MKAAHSESVDPINTGRELPELLCRVRSGDREASAEFISRYGPRIRRRVRGKLSPAMRRLFDSQEILATVARRLDKMVAAGRLQAVSDGQVWSLVFTIADRSLIEKARMFRTLQAREGEDSPLATSMLSRLRRAEREPDGPEMEVERALQSLGDRLDRQILGLWLMGKGATSIAAVVDMEPATVRKRWERIRGQLRDTYASEIAGEG
jgi:DNA-directed RNA polymerase specialized sigma24 family protein